MSKRKPKYGVAAQDAAKASRVQEPTPAGALYMPRVEEIPAGVFKDTCLSLMDEVRDGLKQFIITKHGEPVAKLVSANAPTVTARGFMRGTILETGDIVSPDPEAWGDFG